MSAPEPSNRPRPPGSPSTEAVPPLDWARAAGRVGEVTASIERHVRRRRRVRFATLGAAATIAAAAFIWSGRPGSADAGGASRAVVSAPARQVLPDGSVVELRGDAAIAVNFRGAIRRVTLLRGEAHFKVAKDPAHPFVVEAAGVGVRAVGTAFLVQRSSQAVEVIVTEGKVAVAEAAHFATPAAASGEPPGTLVASGERTRVELAAMAAEEPRPLSTEEIRRRMAWCVARLEFDGTPLREVLRLFNAHATDPGKAPLVLGDPELANLPLSGALRGDNVGVLLQILETSYGIRAATEDGRIVLRRSP